MQTVRQALASYFADNGFDASSYTDKTFTLRFLGLDVVLPNPPPRQKGIRIHDLHHVVTGYATSAKGEAEAAGFELGAGLAIRYPMALFFNTTAFIMGLLRYPLRTLKAFARGVATRISIYHLVRPGDLHQYERVLNFTVVGLKQHLSVLDHFPVVLPLLLRLPLILLYAVVGLGLYLFMGPVLVVGVVKALLVRVVSFFRAK